FQRAIFGVGLLHCGELVPRLSTFDLPCSQSYIAVGVPAHAARASPAGRPLFTELCDRTATQTGLSGDTPRRDSKVSSGAAATVGRDRPRARWAARTPGLACAALLAQTARQRRQRGL